MAIQDFTAGQILTAQQMDDLQANDYNWTVSTKTASYTLAATDKGTRVVMNSASATTITVNTSIFSAGDTLYLQNIGAGVTTLTAGTATISSAGSLAIPQYGSGTLYFTSAGVSIYYPSAVTASASGLTLITTTSFSAVSSFSLPANTFSSTYTNYLMFCNLDASVASAEFDFRFRAAGTDNTSNNYSWVRYGQQEAAGPVNNDSGGSLVSYFRITPVSGTYNAQFQLTFMGPQDNTLNSGYVSSGFYYDSTSNFSGQTSSGVLSVTTSYDSATFFPSSGTITGTYSVYGLAK